MVSENNEIVDEHNEHSEAVSPSSTCSHFGQRLLYIRNSMDLTKSQFALLLKYKSSDISKWESGSEIPDMDTIADIAKKLSIDKSYFLTEEKNPTISSHAARTTGGNLAFYGEEPIKTELKRYVDLYKWDFIVDNVIGVAAFLVFSILSSKYNDSTYFFVGLAILALNLIIDLILYLLYKRYKSRKKIAENTRAFKARNNLDNK